MNIFLRRSSCLLRLSRATIESPRAQIRFFHHTRHVQPLSSPLYRHYATSRPDKSSKDGISNSKNQNKTGEEKEKVAKEQSGETSPKSHEGEKPPLAKDKAKEDSIPDQDRLKSSGDHEKELGSSPKLSSEDERALSEIAKMIKTGMPKSKAEEIDHAFESMKKTGIPPNFRFAMERLHKGENLDLATVVTLARYVSYLSDDTRTQKNTTSKANTDEPRQKAGAHDPGPQSKDQREGHKSEGSPKSSGESRWGWDWTTTIMMTVVGTVLSGLLPPFDSSKEITWQEFKTSYLDKGLVEKVVVLNGHRAKVHLNRQAVSQVYPDSPGTKRNFYYYFTIGSVESFERKLDDAQSELQISPSDRVPVAYKDEGYWFATFMSLAPTLLLIGSVLWFSKRAGSGAGGQNGIFGMGRSRAKRFNHESDVKVKFSDVAGMDEAKQEIMEFVSFLKEPGIYQKLGAKIPRGAILSGPPGTGKTLLAKATAGESQVPFFSVSGSEFVEMFVGVGASRVRDLFSTARKNAPCIIFVDEIDAIGKSRAKQTFGGGNDEREATLNQILTEMDGFNTSDQVVVLAGTNRPDVLDKALMRPGRFDRHIGLDKPTMDGRKQIFAVHLKKIVTKEDIEFLRGRLAALTPGFSGADIANTVNEAALIAARDHATSVKMIHFEKAIERVIGGLEKKSLVLSPEEKRTVAYHEAGHAICGWYFRYADPLLKVSIIPRGQGTLGYAQYLPAGDTYLMNVHQLMDRMAMTLAGRVSEELHFSTVTSGASDDFNKVTRMATAMVTKWGMSRKIGYLYFEDDSSQQLHKPFSEETAKNIDAEVRRIVDEAYKQCRDLLTEKKEQIGIVAEELLRKEALARDDLVRLLGPRPFKENEDFAKYFDGTGGTGGANPLPSPEAGLEGGTGGGGGGGGGAGDDGRLNPTPPGPPSPNDLPPAPAPTFGRHG